MIVPVGELCFLSMVCIGEQLFHRAYEDDILIYVVVNTSRH